MSTVKESLSSPNQDLSRVEFITLMAFMMSFVALAIDAMLPALGVIGNDLGIVNDNDRQLVISSLFLGMVLGQLFCGPISDSVGRKPVILFGVIVFSLGCLISSQANSFETMLVGRFLQGAGAACPRNITTALIRDRYKGNDMAQIMSLIMSVFIFVPMIAPSLGQAILWVSNWRSIFIALLILAIIIQVWFFIRQPETLSPSNRKPLSFLNLKIAFREVYKNRAAMGYTACASLIFGSFVGYLTSSQQILQELYGLGDSFAFYFAAIAASIGLASYMNSTLVLRLGMKTLTRRALVAFCITSSVFFICSWIMNGQPAFWLTLLLLILSFFSIGILFGNLNSLAMEPLGHVAGMASTVIGSTTTLISLLLGTIIGRAYDQSLVPLTFGFTLLGILSLIVFLRTSQEGS
jgi:DHA1 family bicyclomycin/chloramphenicol resistance-like MFS transporter